MGATSTVAELAGAALAVQAAPCCAKPAPMRGCGVSGS
jgi:hypothetical protein